MQLTVLQISGPGSPARITFSGSHGFRCSSCPLDGVFLEALVLGAESVISKAKCEHKVTKLYSGELNPLSKRKTETKVRVAADGEFQTKACEDSWDARSLIAILDGLHSIQALWTLIPDLL